MQIKKIKIEKDSKGKKWTLQEHSCKVCKHCWIYIEKGYCIYGGPFSGYIKDESDKKI